jgi:hypothetical protein
MVARRRSLYEQILAMKFIKSLFQTELFWVLLLIGCLFFFAYYPEYYQFSHPMPNRVYLGFDHFPIDIIGEMTEIQQGARGNWLVYPSATSVIPAQGFFLRVEYLFLGHLSHWLNLSALQIYHLARFVLSGLFIALVWHIIYRNFPNKIIRLIAFGLVLFATGIYPKLEGNWTSVIRFDTNVFQRMTVFKIQYLIGALGSTFSLFCFHRLLKTNRLRYFILASISGIIAANSHVFGEFNTSVSIFLYCLYLMLNKRPWLNVRKMTLWLISYLILLLIPIINLYNASHYYDWNQYARVEKALALRFTVIDFLRYNGLTIIPALIGIIIAFKKKADFFILSSMYMIGYFGFVVFNQIWFLFNPLRIIQIPIYIPMAFLAAFTFTEINTWLTKLKIKSFISISLISGILIIILVSGKNAYRTSYNYFAEPDPYSDGQYGFVYQDEYDAIGWLTKSPQGIVISSNMTGALIEALSPQITYSTVWLHFYEIPEKTNILYNLNTFFTGQLTDQTALDFLKSNRIKYIYCGKNELQDFTVETNQKPYQFLNRVYQNQSVSIYTY